MESLPKIPGTSGYDCGTASHCNYAHLETIAVKHSRCVLYTSGSLCSSGNNARLMSVVRSRMTRFSAHTAEPDSGLTFKRWEIVCFSEVTQQYPSACCAFLVLMCIVRGVSARRAPGLYRYCKSRPLLCPHHNKRWPATSKLSKNNSGRSVHFAPHPVTYDSTTTQLGLAVMRNGPTITRR